jgi:hypothetical protein
VSAIKPLTVKKESRCQSDFFPSKLAPLEKLSARVARFFLIQYTKMGENIPNYKNFTEWSQNIPNAQKIFQMTRKYTNISNLRTSNIYPNWDFWSENIPSGNPGPHHQPASLN